MCQQEGHPLRPLQPLRSVHPRVPPSLWRAYRSQREIRGSCPLPGSTFTSIWVSLLRFRISQPLPQLGCCYGVRSEGEEEEMRYEALLQGCVPGAPLSWDVGLAERGRPASRRGASILAGNRRGEPGASLPGLSPDVISPLRGGSAAKGRALLAPTAPGPLAGVLVIWAVAGDGCASGPRGAGGRGLEESVQGKGRGMGQGWMGGGFQAGSPFPTELGGGAEGSGEAKCALGISR